MTGTNRCVVIVVVACAVSLAAARAVLAAGDHSTALPTGVIRSAWHQSLAEAEGELADPDRDSHPGRPMIP
jgi:hypothetical protein